MILNVMDMLFGCWHTNYSFPITAKKGQIKEAARATGTYVVCLECGKEFPYDWKTMKVVSAKASTDSSPEVLVEAPRPLVSKQAA
jgi:hypothetical protein